MSQAAQLPAASRLWRFYANRGGDLSARARYKVECLVRAGVGPADAVLDFGRGIGNVTCRLVERFHAVHGFEPSAASVASKPVIPTASASS